MAITRDDFFDDGFMEMFPELNEGIREGVEGAFPASRFDERDSAQLQALKERINRLSPIEQPPRQGSTRIPGNPFSFDVSPTINAAQNAIVKGVNAAREKRLLDDDVRTRAGGLKAEKEADAQARENRQEVFKEIYPDIASKAMEVQGNLKEQEERHRQRLDEIEERTTQAIREFNQTDGGSGGTGGGSNPANSVGLVTDFLGQANPYMKSLSRTIETLEEQKAFAANPDEIQSRIDNMRQQIGQIQQWRGDAFRALYEGNLFQEDLIKRLEGIMGAGKKARENPNEVSFVEEMMNWVDENEIQAPVPRPSVPGVPGAAGADTAAGNPSTSAFD